MIGDLRQSIRLLTRDRGFAITAIATLAVGIGINVTVFTVTNATLFKGFPQVAANEQLLYITSNPGCCASYLDYLDWKAQARSFQDMALVHGFAITLTDSLGSAERHTVTEVTWNTFTLAGVKPRLGRDFTSSDAMPGAAPVVILRHSLWETRFGKDPAIVGRTIRLDGVPTTIVGVMPAGFSFPQNQDLWTAIVPSGDFLKRDNRNTWFVFGRLRDGVTEQAARAEMETIGTRLARAYPATNENFPPIVYTFDEFFIGANATTIYQAMWGAVGFVLLIACANLANLLLGRAMARSREIALRVAIGAGRWRIVRQLLIESVMLAAIGGFFGWWLAKWNVRLYALLATGTAISDATPGSWFDNILDYSMDYRVFAYVVAITVATGVLFGLAPARRLARLDVNGVLKDGGHRTSGGGRSRQLSSLLVIAEMALAVVLLAGAGVMIRSFLNVAYADMGVDAERVLTTLTNLPPTRYPDADARMQFFERLDQRLNSLPGVESVAIGNENPGWRLRPWPIEVAGRPPVDINRLPLVPRLIVSPGYFRTLGARLLAGRDFAPDDRTPGMSVAIVNEAMARAQWPGEDPLGKRLRLHVARAPTAWLTVVGVVSNIAQNDQTRQEFGPLVYSPYAQQPMEGMWVFVRTRVPPVELVNDVRREVRALDAELPLGVGPVPLNERFVPANQYRGFTAVLFLLFAAVALLLASLGLYAVVAHSVTQRRQEIGTRIAIGASASDIRLLVFKQGILPLVLGLTVGLAASYIVNRLLQAQLVHVSPADPVTAAIVGVVLLAFAALGCWFPMRRAIRVDPIIALRS